MLIGISIAFTVNKQTTMDFITNEKKINDPTTIIKSLDKEQTKVVFDFLKTKNLVS
jgi:hypothetical protein